MFYYSYQIDQGDDHISYIFCKLIYQTPPVKIACEIWNLVKILIEQELIQIFDIRVSMLKFTYELLYICIALRKKTKNG
jgi:hypothetical protein